VRKSAFTAVLALIRGNVTADTCCPHCGKRPASGNDPIARLVSQILAQPAHRDRPARTSGRTAFQRQPQDSRRREIFYAGLGRDLTS
jgi:hypothetical protein